MKHNIAATDSVCKLLKAKIMSGVFFVFTHITTTTGISGGLYNTNIIASSTTSMVVNAMKPFVGNRKMIKIFCKGKEIKNSCKLCGIY